MDRARDPVTLFTPETREVLAVERETVDTVTLTLAGGGRGFVPGQFAMLYAFGVGESAISLSGDPYRSDVVEHTVRNVGAVTAAIGALTPGGVVGWRGPFGTGWPLARARGGDLVIVAGGIGLAPLRPVILAVMADRGAYRRVALLVGARRKSELLYTEQLTEWRARFDLEVEVTVDAATDNWRGSVGVVTRLIPLLDVEPSRTTAMVCGPEVMMRFSAKELLRLGVPSRNVFVSIERNMKCAVGLCGHCQVGPLFACRDGAVVPYDRVAGLMEVREA
jgi:NAD(P)H-flavin reductase